jgi:hypothetical protein
LAFPALDFKNLDFEALTSKFWHDARAPCWVFYLSADADCAGLPKTRRHPSLKLARCRRMQAVIRSTSGISEEQSRKTSGVHSRR